MSVFLVLQEREGERERERERERESCWGWARMKILYIYYTKITCQQLCASCGRQGSLFQQYPSLAAVIRVHVVFSPRLVLPVNFIMLSCFKIHFLSTVGVDVILYIPSKIVETRNLYDFLLVMVSCCKIKFLSTVGVVTVVILQIMS